MIKKIKNKIQDLSVKIYHSKTASILSKVIGIYSLVSMLHMGQALATDDLSSAKTTLNDDFGKDSTFIGIVYLVEIIVAAVTYIKSKNMMALIGVVVISIFINFGFGHFVFSV